MEGLAGLCAALPPGHEPRCRLSKAVSDGTPKMDEPVESILLTAVPAEWSAVVSTKCTRSWQRQQCVRSCHRWRRGAYCSPR